MSEMGLNLKNEGQSSDGELKKMSFGERVTGILLSPKEVMENLAAKPRILFPIIAIALAQFLYLLIRYPLYSEYMRKTFEKSLEMSGSSGTEMTPEQFDMMAKIGTISGLVGTPFSAVMGLVISTVIILALVKIMKGEGTFVQYMSVVGYASVINVLYVAVTLVVSLITNNLYMDIPLASIAVLLPEGMKGSFLFGIIKGLDVFYIWQYIVIGIGIAAVSKLKNAKVYTIIAILLSFMLLFIGAGEAYQGAFMK